MAALRCFHHSRSFSTSINPAEAPAASTSTHSPSRGPGVVSSHGFAASPATIEASSSDCEPYTVTVVTGRRRGAGTTDPVAVQLIGTHASSDRFLLDSNEGGFDRGSTVTFTVPVPRDLGPLRRLLVSKESTLDIGGAWYLRLIEIANPAGEATIFPCNSWIGEDSTCSSEAHHSIERNLLPAATEMIEGHHEAVSVRAAGLSFPHPDKVKGGVKGVNRQGFGYGGEDAYFFCEGRNNLFGMGVADGVYMWRDVGIDSGVLAQTLMRTACDMMQKGVEDVYKVLETSSHVALVDGGLQGSCTASLLTINASGQLHAANLGDSGFMVLGPPHGSRGQMSSHELEVRFRSAQLEHEFGRPYQIGHHVHASKVSDADLVSFYVCRGDVIVMGSDGLLDNVSDERIAALLTSLLAQGAGPARMVQELTRIAYEASVDKRADTPYARDASSAFNMVYNGGKKDDITVLVALCK
ncbi:hypothetical protein FOA52_015614 [Chlamydomonas sp. UWO 241]|nr:hypothetical protein FOA52_015614 [Chlamydomonas sp. UWO 241]